MANCAPCLRLGLQVVAHYDADRTSGKEAECYYHHFGFPLPKALQEKITQPKPEQPNVDEHEDEDSDAPAPERAKHGPYSGSVSGKRGDIKPDVCAECWKNGHVCPPHCTVDGERLCIDCADGKPCAHVRAKETNPQAAVHERYRVTIPAREPAKKPANATQPKTLPIPPQPRKPASISLALDEKGVPARMMRPSAAPARVEEHFPQMAAVASIQVPTAGKDRQEEKERTSMKTPGDEIPRYCGRDGCTKKLTRANKSGFCTKHFYDSKKKSANGAPDDSTRAPLKSQAAPPRKTNAKPAQRAASQPANGIATLVVTEHHLDTFWSRLSLEEKTNLFQRQLDGV